MIKKLIYILLAMLMVSPVVAEIDFSNYTKEFKSEEIDVCSNSSVKTYMDYRAITNKRSKQWKYIEEHMTVDEETGLLFDEEGFFGVALGYYFGDIGSRYYITLSNGQILPVVKIDAKASIHATNGCQHDIDGSVIEFVIDSQIAGNFFGKSSTGFVSSGNLNHVKEFEGNIVKIEKVLDEKLPEEIEMDYSNVTTLDSIINFECQDTQLLQ